MSDANVIVQDKERGGLHAITATDKCLQASPPRSFYTSNHSKR